MKKALLLLIALFGINANAQLEKSLLWKITGKELNQASYLFGTIHASCDAELSPEVLIALEETKQLYLEIDMDSPDLQKQMISGIVMKDELTISKLIESKEYTRLDDFMKKNIGISIKTIDNYKPFFINSLFIPMLLDCPFKSIESELVAITKKQNEQVYGLETIESQLSIFDEIPYKEQMDEVLNAIDSNLKKEKEQLQTLTQLYKDKEIEKMILLIDEDKESIMNKYNEQLLTNRNKNWVPVIIKAIHNTGTFFGVGAAHLAGNDGVIQLLRNEGYTVEAVK